MTGWIILGLTVLTGVGIFILWYFLQRPSFTINKFRIFTDKGNKDYIDQQELSRVIYKFIQEASGKFNVSTTVIENFLPKDIKFVSKFPRRTMTGYTTTNGMGYYSGIYSDDLIIVSFGKDMFWVTEKGFLIYETIVDFEKSSLRHEFCHSLAKNLKGNVDKQHNLYPDIWELE